VLGRGEIFDVSTSCRKKACRSWPIPTLEDGQTGWQESGVTVLGPYRNLHDYWSQHIAGVETIYSLAGRESGEEDGVTTLGE